LHKSKLPLTVWFLAIYLVAHDNQIKVKWAVPNGATHFFSCRGTTSNRLANIGEIRETIKNFPTPLLNVTMLCYTFCEGGVSTWSKT
jgi:hypothetical protein